MTTETPPRRRAKRPRSPRPRNEGGAAVGCWLRSWLLVVAAAVVLVVTDPFSGGRRSVGRGDRQRVRHLDPGGGAGVDLAADAGECDARLRRGPDDPPAGRERAGRGDAGAADGDDRSGDALESRSRRCRATPRRCRQARATLAADQQQESVDCAGNNAAQAPSAGSGAAAGGAPGAAPRDAQLVATGQQSVTADAAKVVGRSEPGQFGGALARGGAVGARDARARRRPRTARTRRSRVFPRRARSCGADSRCSRSTASLCCCSTGPTVATRAFVAGMSRGRGRGGAEREPRRARLRARADG